MRKVHFPSFWMDLFNPKLLLKFWWKVALWYIFESQMPNYVVFLWEPKACRLHNHAILCPSSKWVRMSPGKFFKSMHKILHFCAFWVSLIWSHSQHILKLFSWGRQKMKQQVSWSLQNPVDHIDSTWMLVFFKGGGLWASPRNFFFVISRPRGVISFNLRME